MWPTAAGGSALILLGLHGCSPVNSVAIDDLVDVVPGWKGELPSRQFSGYLDIPGGKHLHYVLVESELDPGTAPLVLWLNGGPGCSSLDGYIYEHGPFVLEGPDYSRLSLRPFRWNLQANMLYLEAPVGVGFSSADDPSVYAKNDDDTTAIDNLKALEAFFRKFPEYKERNFFITGESYAGVYVPTLAEAIVEASILDAWEGAPLKGIAVGNGCTGSEVGICGSGPQADAYLWQYMLQTAFISLDLKASASEACDFRAAIEELKPLSPECYTVLTQASTQISNINLYDIYGDCIDSYSEDSSRDRPLKAPHGSFLSSGLRAGASSGMPGPVACIDSNAATSFFSNPLVQDAYHVKPPNGSAPDWQFSVCGQANRKWGYRHSRPNLPRDTYPTLVKHMRVVIYNGDWDSCVPYTDNEAWTRMMAYPIKTPFRTWNYTSLSGATNQVGGYAVEYEVGSKGAFVFTTIRGGRHEVPESAPAQASEFLRRFLNGASF